MDRYACIHMSLYCLHITKLVLKSSLENQCIITNKMILSNDLLQKLHVTVLFNIDTGKFVTFL